MVPPDESGNGGSRPEVNLDVSPMIECPHCGGTITIVRPIWADELIHELVGLREDTRDHHATMAALARRQHDVLSKLAGVLDSAVEVRPGPPKKPRP